MALICPDGCHLPLCLPLLLAAYLAFDSADIAAGQSFPVAERIARRGFYIPSGAHAVIAVAIAPAKVLLNHNASGQALP